MLYDTRDTKKSTRIIKIKEKIILFPFILNGRKEGKEIPGELGGGEDIGRPEAGADPIEERADLLVLEGPLEAVRVQRIVAVEPQLPKDGAQPGTAHRLSASPETPAGKSPLFSLSAVQKGTGNAGTADLVALGKRARRLRTKLNREFSVILTFQPGYVV